MSSIRRFYFSPDARRGDSVRLPADESRHGIRVLRLQVGDRLELFDGEGGVFLGTVTDCSRRLIVQIDESLPPRESDGASLTVVQAILRGEKMDQVVQKCTELGVSRLVPVMTERCQGRPVGEKGLRKLERWRRISLESCKQCLRVRPMEIETPKTFSEVVEAGALKSEIRLFFWEGEERRRLSEVEFSQQNTAVRMIFGPEGGFTDAEVAELIRADWLTVSLGNRILRAETASLAGVTLVQFLTGNL